MCAGTFGLGFKKYQESKFELPIAVGKTITNEVFMFDLTKMPHLLIAGATGQGKICRTQRDDCLSALQKEARGIEVCACRSQDAGVFSPMRDREALPCQVARCRECYRDGYVACCADTQVALCPDGRTLQAPYQSRVRNVMEYNELYKARNCLRSRDTVLWLISCLSLMSLPTLS